MNKQISRLDVTGTTMLSAWLVITLINILVLDPRILWVILSILMIATLVIKTRHIRDDRSVLDSFSIQFQTFDWRSFTPMTKRNLVILNIGVFGIWFWFINDATGILLHNDGAFYWVFLILFSIITLFGIVLLIIEKSDRLKQIKYSTVAGVDKSVEIAETEKGKDGIFARIPYKRTAKLYNIMEFNQTSGQIVFIKKGIIINAHDITSIKLEVDKKIVYSNGIIESITGGVLFGGGGAIAGSMISSKPRIVDKATLYIETKLVRYAGIAIKTTPEKGFEVCRTIELLREQMSIDVKTE